MIVVESTPTSHLAAACDCPSTHQLKLIAAIVAGVATVGTGYMAFGRGTKAKEAPALAITPVIGLDSAGATVRLAW